MNIDKIKEITRTVQKQIEEAARLDTQIERQRVVDNQKENARMIIEDLPNQIYQAANKGYNTHTILNKFWGKKVDDRIIGGNILEQIILDWCEKEKIPVKIGWDSEMGEGGHCTLYANWSE